MNWTKSHSIYSDAAKFWKYLKGQIRSLRNVMNLHVFWFVFICICVCIVFFIFVKRSYGVPKLCQESRNISKVRTPKTLWNIVCNGWDSFIFKTTWQKGYFSSLKSSHNNYKHLFFKRWYSNDISMTDLDVIALIFAIISNQENSGKAFLISFSSKDIL